MDQLKELHGNEEALPSLPPHTFFPDVYKQVWAGKSKEKAKSPPIKDFRPPPLEVH